MNFSSDPPFSKTSSNDLTFNQTSPSTSIPNKLFSQVLCKNYIISLQNLSDPLTTYFKTTKCLVWNLRDRTKISPERKRKVVHILRNQLSLSELKLILDSNTPFETTLFSSQIKHLSSLDTLELEFNTRFASILKGIKALAISLPSLKNVTTLNLTFSSSEFPHSGFLNQLLRSLKTLKNLINLSLKFENPRNMTDADLDFIRFHLCKLIRLHSLTLILNNTRHLTNHSIASLALNIPKFSCLNKIHLELTGFSSGISNMMTSSTIFQFFSSFQTLKNLTDITLDLERSIIQFDTSTDPLSEGLLSLQLSQIKRLKLYPNKDYGASAFLNLGKALSKFNSLQTLDLSLCSTNWITVENINQTLSQVQKLPNLSSLRLRFSSLNITSSLVANVAPVLKTLKGLKSLKLDFLELMQTKDEEITMLSASLASLTSLISLSISFKKTETLTNKSLESLALSLKGLPLLKNFSLNILNADWVTNDGVEALAEGLKGLKNLNTLGLSFHNNRKMNQEGLESIISTLERLPKLFKISLNFMNCKGLVTPSDTFQNLLRVVKDLRNLQEVALVVPYNIWVIDQVKSIQRKVLKVTYFV